MNKEIIINALNSEFDIYRRVDLWGRFTHLIAPIETDLTSSFKKYFSGLMFDFTDEIDEIITTVFVSESLLKYLIENGKKNVLVFTHHPFWQNQYDYSWISLYPNYLNALKENKISIYSCHMPLDLHPRFSNDYYLSRQLIDVTTGRLSAYDGYFNEEITCGYYGKRKNDLDNILKSIKPDYGRFMSGKTEINIIACSPGGGGMIEYIEAAKKAGVDTYITGVCVNKGNNAISKIVDFFSKIKDLDMNIIELSHYSTECIVMKELPRDYFNQFDCKCSFFEE